MYTKNDEEGRGIRAVKSGVLNERIGRSLNAVEAARNGAKQVQKTADLWRNASPEQLAGRLAEDIHALTFNVDAASKGFNKLRAFTGAGDGSPTATADVFIKNGKDLLGQAQIKVRNTSARTALDIADTKYDKMQRVVPSDQLTSVKRISSVRGNDGLGKRNYPAVADSSTDHISYGKVKSKPITRAELLEAAEKPGATAEELVRGQKIKAIKGAALIGGGVSGGISIIKNISKYENGKISGGEAIGAIARDTTVGAISGAAVSTVAIAAEGALVKVGMKSLARSSAPVAVGLTVLDGGKDFFKYLEGDISGEELVGRCGKHAARGATTWGGMELGAAFGSAICPGFGTIVGGILGGIFGSSVID